MLENKKLKVLQVLPALESGGVERGTLELAKYLVEHGHESIVISAGGRLTNDLIRDGSKHIKWEIGRKSLFTFMLVRRLRKLLIEQSIDILHVRSRFPAWVCYLAWKSIEPNQRPKFITTVHGAYSVSWYSAVMLKGEKVIVVSDMIKNYVLSHYSVDPTKICRIYRGVDTKKYRSGYQPKEKWLLRWRKAFPQLQEKFVITLPARITRGKGHADFIELIALLKKQSLNVHGLIVGDAQENKKKLLLELESLVEEKSLVESISFLGHRSDLRKVMAVSNVVVSMSLQPEAFGRTAIEGLSLGVPVIAYAHGGVEEQMSAVFPEGKVEVGHIQQAADLITKWAIDPPKVPREHPFSLQNMLNETMGVYLNKAY